MIPFDPEPFPDVDHSNHSIEMRRVDIFEKLLDTFNFGFSGAVSFGTNVGFIIVFLSFWELYSNDCPAPIFVILVAAVIGFMGGLYKGWVSKLRS